MATTAFPSATSETVDAIYDSTAVEQDEHILQQHVCEVVSITFPNLAGLSIGPLTMFIFLGWVCCEDTSLDACASVGVVVLLAAVAPFFWRPAERGIVQSLTL